MPARFNLVKGVRIYPDGREVCVTQAAWDRRRRERLEIARFRCECVRDCKHHLNKRCNRLLAAHVRESPSASVAHVHHATKGGRGLGGGRRDDRVEKLRADCLDCHFSGHEEERFPGLR